VSTSLFQSENNISKKHTFEYELADDLKEQLTKYVKDYAKDPNDITNPLIPGSKSFPYVYLWSACADWAIKSSMDFTDMFSSKMGLDWSKLQDQRYEKVRKSLKHRV